MLKDIISHYKQKFCRESFLFLSQNVLLGTEGRHLDPAPYAHELDPILIQVFFFFEHKRQNSPREEYDTCPGMELLEIIVKIDLWRVCNLKS